MDDSPTDGTWQARHVRRDMADVELATRNRPGEPLMTQQPDERLVAARRRIDALYSPSTFAAAVGEWSEAVTRHFEALARDAVGVQQWRPPTENVDHATQLLNRTPLSPEDRSQWQRRFAELVTTALARGQNLHHRRYCGHQVPPSIPLAGLFDAIGSATNQVMAIYEMGPWATSVERVLIDAVGQQLGFQQPFAGSVTHGGSLANLTALLTARNVQFKGVWKSGVAATMAGPPAPALIVHADAHYCISRAAGILGLGTNQLIRAPLNDRRTIDVDQLRTILQQLARQGRPIVAVVAVACATPTGAFDDLVAIADLCAEYEVWMHVDAAHGGAAAFSETHRACVAGLARADSVVFDAHKMLFMPALCAFVFLKNRDHRFAAFQQDAPYLFDPAAPDMAEYDSGTQTLECTKRAAAYGLWGIWSLFGPQLFGDLVDVCFDLTQTFFAMLNASPDFIALHRPMANIQVFRYRPEWMDAWTPDQVGDFQLRLRRRVMTHGFAYLVPIKIDGVGALRVTLIHPETRDHDLARVLDEIRDQADKLRSECET